MSWASTLLSEVAKIDRRGVSPDSLSPSTRYVGLEHIDHKGVIESRETVESAALKSTKFEFTPSHVLFGKLRPYLCKIARPEFDGVCSTDILPILPNCKLDSGYLYHFLRQPSQVELATRRSSGANLPRLSPKELAKFEIPLPPLEEQKRIAAILDQADELRKKRKEAIDQLDTLLQSTFLDMFGDPVTNPKGWEVKTLDELTNRVTDGTHQSPRWSEQGVPFLFVSNIREREISFDTEKFISEEEFERLTARCPIEPGDVLYTTVGSYGNPALIHKDMPTFAFQRHIAHIKPNKSVVNPEFLESMLDSPVCRRQADQLARGVAQKTLNLRELKSFKIVLPPLPEQMRFINCKYIIQEQRSRMRKQLCQFDSLFESVQARAFKGDL
jgi:type I restriction enzyme S subunit